jgi:hypothetical protein
MASDGTVSLIAVDGRETELGHPAIETAFHFPTRQALTTNGDMLVLVESGSMVWQIAGAAGR